MAQMLKLNTSYRRTEAPWDAEQALSDALAERALFLNEHPRYQEYQDQIDHMLDKAGNAEGRMSVLAILMEAKLVELSVQFKRLNSILLKAAK